MASVIAEFFGIIGVSQVPPDNLAELIPYVLTIVVGVALVSGVFRVIGCLVELLTNYRHW